MRTHSRAFGFYSPDRPLWIGLLAVFALLIFGASDSYSASWKFVPAVHHHSLTASNDYVWTFSAPPICTRNFVSKEDALNCLRGAQTDPYYVSGIGAVSNRTAVYGNFYEKYSMTLNADRQIDPRFAALGSKCLGNVANQANCFLVLPSTFGSLSTNAAPAYNTVYLVDSAGNPLNNSSGDRQLWHRHRNATNWAQGTYNPGAEPWFLGSPLNPENSTRAAPFGPESTVATALYLRATFGLAYFPDEAPSGSDPEDTCVGKYRTIAIDLAWYKGFNGGKGPYPAAKNPGNVPVPYYDIEALCDYDFVDVNESFAAGAGLGLAGVACLTPFPGEDMVSCRLKGVADLSNVVLPRGGDNLEDSEASYIDDGNPLVLTIGKDTESQGWLKVPVFADLALGWGAPFGTKQLTELQLTNLMPILIENWDELNGEQQLKLRLAYMMEDMIEQFTAYEPAPTEKQDYYHPGNYDAAGGYIGAFDRDWGKTDFDPLKEFNWDPTTPAKDVPKENREVISKDTSTGKDRVVSATSVSTGTKSPPGTSQPDGTVTPPVGGGNGDNDSAWPSVGDWLGSYEKQGALYESKYPGGLGGAMNDAVTGAQQASGAGEIIGLIAFNGSTSIVGDLCYSFPVALLGYDFSSTGNRGLCIPDSILNLMRALFILGAGIYAINLIFGGD